MLTELLEPYRIAIVVTGLSSLLFLVQLVVADIVGILARHTPGHPVMADHDVWLFRAVRAFSNSSESAAIYVLAVLFAIASAANAVWVNLGAALYLAGRLGHMVFYYANLKLCRSVAFGLSLLGIAMILAAGLMRWL